MFKMRLVVKNLEDLLNTAKCILVTKRWVFDKMTVPNLLRDRHAFKVARTITAALTSIFKWQ